MHRSVNQLQAQLVQKPSAAQTGLLTLGHHGLDVAAPVLGEDEVFGAPRLAQGALVQLGHHQDVGVHHCAVRLDDELLGQGLGLQIEGLTQAAATGQMEAGSMPVARQVQ